MTHVKKEIFVVFLGKRGGGSQLTSKICSDFINSGLSDKTLFITSIDSETYLPSSIDQIEIVTISSIRNLFSEFFRVFSTFKILFRIKKNFSPKFVIYVMPSPFDKLVYRTFKSFKSQSIFLIHDSHTHMGEKWPRKRSIAWRVKSANVVGAFSEFVISQLREIKKETQIALIDLPENLYIYQGKNDSISREIQNLNTGYILFVGRILPYKGVSNLVDAFKLAHVNLELVIAGDGNLDLIEENNIKYINRWLSEREILELISKAKFVVFPYLEASQSGLVPLVIKQEKLILITDVGGLREQVQNYSARKIIKPNSIEELSSALWALSQEDIVLTSLEDSKCSHLVKTEKIKLSEILSML